MKLNSFLLSERSHSARANRWRGEQLHGERKESGEFIFA